MSARKSKVQSFYFDMEWLSRYWGVEGRPRVYHHTAPVSNFYALREGLAMVAEEVSAWPLFLLWYIQWNLSMWSLV